MSRPPKTDLTVPSGKPVMLEPPYIQHRGRRDYSHTFKRQVVHETLVPGASVSVVARRHNINSNVVFRWRAQHRRGELAALTGPACEAPEGFIPVGVIGKDGRLVKTPVGEKASLGAVAVAAIVKPASLSSYIELELSGGMKLRFDAAVDRESLRRLLAVVKEFA